MNCYNCDMKPCMVTSDGCYYNRCVDCQARLEQYGSCGTCGHVMTNPDGYCEACKYMNDNQCNICQPGNTCQYCDVIIFDYIISPYEESIGWNRKRNIEDEDYSMNKK